MDIRPAASPAPAERDLAASAPKRAAPVEASPTAPAREARKLPDQVVDAVAAINKSLQASGQNVEFTVDTDSQRTVIKVVDQETQQVLRQMPTEEALEIAKALDRISGRLIQHEA